MHHHRVADNRVAIIHNETTVVNNYVTENNTTIINAGIPPAVIAEKTREPVQKMRIRELDLEIESIARVGQIDANGKTMAVYRPQVPTLPDTPGEKPGGRTPVTKNPTPEDSSADKPEADQKILKQYGNGTSVADRSKITGRLTPGILARPLGRSYTRPRSSGAIAASPSPTGLAKPGRGASASAKPDASGSQTLKSTFSAPSKSRTTPSKPSARKSYSRSSPRVNTTRKPGPSATSRLVTPSTRSSATPSRAWQQRPSPRTAHPARRDARWLPSQPRGPRACQAHARSLRATAHRTQLLGAETVPSRTLAELQGSGSITPGSFTGHQATGTFNSQPILLRSFPKLLGTVQISTRHRPDQHLQISTVQKLFSSGTECSLVVLGWRFLLGIIRFVGRRRQGSALTGS